MSKGDHVFNNVVSKLRGAFLQGLSGYLRARAAAPGARGPWAAGATMNAGDWLGTYAPRTRGALDYFTSHPELAEKRNRLQTSTYQGGDVNNAAYSLAAREFESAVGSYFGKLATLRRGAESGNRMLPDVARVRRAFLKMTQAAQDPDARRRLLDEHAEQPAQRARLERDIQAVEEAMSWAWGRCEYLFRMQTIESLTV